MCDFNTSCLNTDSFLPKDDAITNADEQHEIVNEPNIKTDREEENKELVKPESTETEKPTTSEDTDETKKRKRKQ